MQSSKLRGSNSVLNTTQLGIPNVKNIINPKFYMIKLTSKQFSNIKLLIWFDTLDIGFTESCYSKLKTLRETPIWSLYTIRSYFLSSDKSIFSKSELFVIN